MATLILSTVLASLLLGGVFFLIKFGKKYGENIIARKSLEETLDDIEEAKNVRDNLTPTKRKRLRDKYTRK